MKYKGYTITKKPNYVIRSGDDPPSYASTLSQAKRMAQNIADRSGRKATVKRGPDLFHIYAGDRYKSTGSSLTNAKSMIDKW